LPTGLIRQAQTRSRENSHQAAMAEILEEKRTIRFQADEVIDHESGKRMKAIDYMKGYMNKIW
jgi:hypothetical protein